MSRRAVAAWAAVAMITIILTWIALGHTGNSKSPLHVIHWIPFGDFARNAGCVFTRCHHNEQASRYLLIDILGNIVVFAPLGIALCIALRQSMTSRLRAILIATAIGMGISIIYEIAQWWIPGRVVATDDVLLNTLGTAFGAWIGSLLPSRTDKLDSVSLKT
jgi:glycopeptide antibiotics resistance protein